MNYHVSKQFVFFITSRLFFHWVFHCFDLKIVFNFNYFFLTDAGFYKGGRNLIDANSLRGWDFSTKIKHWMQINIWNAKNKFSSSYLQKCVHDQRKTDFNCQIYKLKVWLEMGENSFAFNSIRDWDISNCFQNYTRITVVHGMAEHKFTRLFLKIRAGGRTW